jgi:hypothetical protein
MDVLNRPFSKQIKAQIGATNGDRERYALNIVEVLLFDLAFPPFSNYLPSCDG